jgi:cytochrome P450
MHDSEQGKPKDFSQEGQFDGEIFADYVDWRHDHPSDDLMTRLIVTEFEDEHGVTRRLSREEVMIYVNSLAGAGNETTNRLIGWTGGLLAQHPDARREIAEDRSLVRNAIEEILRYEPPNYGMARYVDVDTTIQGQMVKAGSAVVLLVPSANRDDSVFPRGDEFDIHRDIRRHFSFGYGAHFCLGASLARMEGRIVLDEILDRFPDWEVDWTGAYLQHIVGHRGYGSLPVSIR